MDSSLMQRYLLFSFLNCYIVLNIWDVEKKIDILRDVEVDFSKMVHLEVWQKSRNFFFFILMLDNSYSN